MALQAIRGMADMLPSETALWQVVENILKKILFQYGYQEMRLPILEKTELYVRSVGEVTDIVEKEMYTFEDRRGESLTLRPEGTAGCVRAGIQHGLLHNQIQRWWYAGPMFRYERPQKGRYRQFHQLGVEAFGMDDPLIDAELIALSARWWQVLGIAQTVQLHINSLGTASCRARYRTLLVEYFNQHLPQLDADSLRRLSHNPLRILDSKNPDMAECIAKAPSILDVLDEASDTHFQTVCRYLDEMKIAYVVNPRLVRGLDYYDKTVFEWITDDLGAQGAICAGGRYDQLVALLGGSTTPAVGMAVGLERLILLCREHTKYFANTIHIYCINNDPKRIEQLQSIAEMLRLHHPDWSVIIDASGQSPKTQFKRAMQLGAKSVIEWEENGDLSIRFLKNQSLVQCSMDGLLKALTAVLEIE